ncbi:unnamed protein product [Prunus armeniaca]|uniref:Uncharacterized protein n=1 Tax=Prunus armeniaca TaxID=36596 RepID=A0A6J5URA5_PRUAR|nr:unnamed protein product [Prunus armeniaca]
MMFIDMVLVDTAVEPGQNGTGESRVNLGGRWGRAHLVATLGGWGLSRALSPFFSFHLLLLVSI